MKTKDILEKVRTGALSVEEAEALFRRKPFEDLGFAKLDSHRHLRSGAAEVVFCQGKSDEHLAGIFDKLMQSEGEVLGTRASAAQAALIQARFPEVVYDPVSRIIAIGKPGKRLRGLITVCSAGTSDIPIAEEAARTAEFLGNRVERIYDVGISGLHRLLSHIDTIQKAHCVIAVAGMEGALASVLGGLVDKPVIAVPTSVGYGASFEGLSALLTMLNSCSNGVATVNIDNGFGAGYLASQINLAICQAEEQSTE